MEKPSQPREQRLFKTPQEEVAYLKEQLKAHEALRAQDNPEKHPYDIIKNYRDLPPQTTLTPSHTLPSEQVGEMVLNLSPETHDAQIKELLVIARDKGIKNALSVAYKLNSPHLEDDFHRSLVEYLKETEPAGSSGMLAALQMTLYEISLPPATENHHEESDDWVRKIISAMEQFYGGLMTLGGEKPALNRDFFSLEIAVENGNEEAVFYVAVPDKRTELFEKQVLSLFPEAQVTKHPNDYNIFNPEGVVSSSRGMFTRNKIFPLRSYEHFNHDPLNVILAAFAKLKREGEGAALQIVVSPMGEWYTKLFRDAYEQAKKGTPLKEAIDIPESIGEDLFKFAKDFFFSKEAKPHEGPRPEDEAALKAIERKLESPIVPINLRLITSAHTKDRADAILADLEASFGQFEDPQGNRLEFKRLSRDAKLRAFTHLYSYRDFDPEHVLTVNLKELTALYHFPKSGTASSRELKQASATHVPAPLDLPPEGIILGVNRYQGVETPIHLAEEDRLRHFYCIGQTGTGKSTLLKNMIVQDIGAGNGLCFIDPHGSDIVDILAHIPPHRHKDVIYFDPAHTERPLGLNMLEYDEAFPEQKTFVINEMLAIFNKLFDMKVAGGPAFEQYFRNSALLVMEHPSSGNTLFEIARVLSDKSFRTLKLSHTHNPILKQFWESAEKTSGEQSLANFVPYITNKFDSFTSNDIMRPIIGQERSSFNFREVMDNRKILLVNLSKGRLGELNANLLGLVIVGKILMAALSRVSAPTNVPPFYLYIDEFQNVTTDSIATMLSEARKYKLGLIVAHQFLKQLEDPIKDAVFGNVGNLCAFRIGSEDGEVLEKHLAPVFASHDLMTLENRHAYIRMLARGKPLKPFDLETLPPPKGAGDPELLKRLSSETYGRPREEIEQSIATRFKSS